MDPQKQLEYAHNLSGSFQRACDDLNASIVEVEEALTGLGLGVPARVPFGSNYLAWGKSSAGWRISVETNGHASRLTDCSLETRTLAIACLPTLFDELLVSADQITSHVRASAAQARKFAAALKETTP